MRTAVVALISVGLLSISSMPSMIGQEEKDCEEIIQDILDALEEEAPELEELLADAQTMGCEIAPLPVSPFSALCPPNQLDPDSELCLGEISADRFCPEGYPREEDVSSCNRSDFTDEAADTVIMWYCPSSCSSEDRTQETMHNSLLDTNDDGGFWSWAHHFVDGVPTELDCDYFFGDNWGLDKLVGTISTDTSHCVDETLHAKGRWTVGVDFR